MTLINEISNILSWIIKLLSAYIGVTLLFALRALPIFSRKRASAPKPDPKTKFAVLIPARNEENVIAGIVSNLRSQNYPEDLFDVIVIPNNCTDDTLGAAKRAGAKIMLCGVPVKNKGEVLHDILGRLVADSDYGAFAVFDADNIADENFLRETDIAIQNGALITKGRQAVKNPYDSATATCYAVWFELFSRLYNTSRHMINKSAKLVGTGFSVTRELLVRKGGWNTTCICEDTEFNIQCVLEGVNVTWVPKAITYDEQPNSLRVSIIQRRRWASGVMHAGAMYIKPLFLNLFSHKHSFIAFDMLIALLVPYGQVLSLIPTGIGIWYAAVFGVSLSTVITLAVTYGAVALVALVTALFAGYKDKRIIPGCLYFPFFLVTWVPLQVYALVNRSTTWTAIPHKGGDTVKIKKA